MTKWVIEADIGTKKFEATFPDQTEDRPELGSYIRLVAGGKQGYFRTAILEGASENYVFIASDQQDFISKGALKGVRNGTEAQYTEVKRWRYSWHRLLRDPTQRLALTGAILTLASLIMDGVLAADKVISDWVICETATFWLTLGSFAMKIIGVGLIFWKGVLDKEGS